MKTLFCMPDPQQSSPCPWLRYVLAIVLVAVFAALRIWPLQALGLRLPYLMLYPAVVITSLYGGFSAGSLAMLLSALAVLFLNPSGQALIQDSTDWLGLAVFLANCTMIALIGEAMLRTRLRAKQETRLAEASHASLRQSEEKLRAVLESTPDGLIVIDEAGAIRFANQRMSALFGYTQEQLLDMRVEQLIPERFRAQHASLLLEYFGQPRAPAMAEGMSLFGLTQSGHELPLEISLSLINTEGEPRVYAFIREISQRKKIEERLVAEKEFSASLAETAQAIVLQLDLEGRILKANPLFNKISGYDGSEVVGQDWFGMFLPEEDRPKVKQLFHALMHTDAVYGHMNPIVTKAGQRHYLRWSTKRLTNPQGQIEGLLLIGQDVTDLEETKSAESRFLATASHELKQPLQALRLYNQVLKKTLSGDKAAHIVRGQQRALDEIEDLLNAYLEIRLIENGEITPKFSEFPVMDMLDRMRSRCASIAQPERLEIHFSRCSAMVRSDPALLGRILENLLTCTIKYTHSGKILIGCRRRGANLRIEVWHTGIGIPEDRLGDIVEELHPLDNPAGERRRGCGLGLNIAGRLARLLGHRIEVCSELGKGSMFAIEVPDLKNLEADSAHDPAPKFNDDQPCCSTAAAVVIEENGPSLPHSAGCSKVWGR